ncbi:membrane-anchored ubiquitin-fold protein 3-like [Camellia sinensis]|uniref:membrane-anchored ubiquitin-fold protein 3-like n=1 Tax=Camellia sinensis TaxID=4442 RepID=UPI00103633FA|nr:membrane-anchored ubiquitin-fold protein 3-like [Camellia sinensis]
MGVYVAGPYDSCFIWTSFQGHLLMNSLNCFTNHIHGLPLASNALVREMFIHSMHMHVRVWVHHMFTDKSVVPKSVSDIKLIHAGKVLENGKTLAESRVHFGDLPGGVSTMHVVVQPPVPKKKTDKNQEKNHKQNSCSCAIL